MPKYSPFAEKAGVKRVAEQESVKSVAKISQLLASLGFDLQFLGSKHYVKVSSKAWILNSWRGCERNFCTISIKVPSAVCQLRASTTVLFKSAVDIC
jgi:hypothetical protein